MVYHLSPVQTRHLYSHITIHHSLTCTITSPVWSYHLYSHYCTVFLHVTCIVMWPVQSHHLYSYITCIVTPVHSDSLSYHQVGVFTLITVPLSSLAYSWCWLGDRTSAWLIPMKE